MQEKKSLVEEALIQMKNVEEAIAENAKGILASTMKEEINQLVKESLSEQVEDDADVEMDVDVDDEIDIPSPNMDTDNEDEVDVDLNMGTDSDETPIDLTDASDEEILKVFKAMGEKDGIIVKKDGDDIHLKDDGADTEYLVKLGESEEEKNLDEMYEDNDEDFDTQKVIDALFSNGGMTDEVDQDEEVMYEIEFDGSDDDEMMESDDDAEAEHLDEQNWEESLDEAYNHKKVKKSETKEGKKMSAKPKGVGIGSGPKFKYKDKAAGGFKEDKKEGPKTMGTGKAKFEYKKGANMEGKSKVVKKAETKEAARTLGMGSDFRKGGLPKHRAHSKFNTAIKEETLQAEVKMLREKNEEYRKALNVFREKLNEVAIFNSNLAYATRLFTEHSTTKKEKINILRRFDDVETLKESKSLYKSIKDELGGVEKKTVTESVSKINKSVSSGSSTKLIESKTYENPQFLRIKDLMHKLG